MLKKLSKKIALTSVAICCMAQAFASDFPVTFEHKFGTTVITEEPKNIATLDFQGADDLLALGAQPVAIRYWYGDHPKTVWPWAAEKLTSNPLVIKNTIDYEKLAATKPDVIIALWSGITDKDYAKLIQIAPVVAVPKGVGDYALSWDKRAIMTGRAIGKEAEAKGLVSKIQTKITDIAASHPQWKGKTMAVPYIYEKVVSAYSKTDIRTQLIEQLGFVLPESLEKIGKGFQIKISNEKIKMLDLDLLVWVPSSKDKHAEIQALSGRKFLDVYKDGREVFLDEIEVGAFSHASLLSLPFALDGLVEKIEVALDKK